MSKGKRTDHTELKKNGWFQKNGTMDGCEIWINNSLVAYLYFDPVKKVVRDVIYV